MVLKAERWEVNSCFCVSTDILFILCESDRSILKLKHKMPLSNWLYKDYRVWFSSYVKYHWILFISFCILNIHTFHKTISSEKDGCLQWDTWISVLNILKLLILSIISINSCWVPFIYQVLCYLLGTLNT